MCDGSYICPDGDDTFKSRLLIKAEEVVPYTAGASYQDIVTLRSDIIIHNHEKYKYMHIYMDMDDRVTARMSRHVEHARIEDASNRSIARRAIHTG